MNLATFDLNLLRVFDAILREGSTVKAGIRLGLSQSAVSNALARLRKALDDDLFVRQGNRLVATDFTASIQDDLREELNRIESLLTPPHTFDPTFANGTFKVAASDFFAELLMPQLGDLLNKKAPNIRAQLVDLVPYDSVSSLERYDADIALLPEVDTPDWISREPLFRSPFVVIASASNPSISDVPEGGTIPFETFCCLSHVLFSPEGKLSAFGDDALARVGRSRRVTMSLPFFSGVCRVVSESNLIAMVPKQLACKVAKDFQLKIFQPPMDVPHAQIIAIWHKRSDRNLLAGWMRRQIFELMKELDLEDMGGPPVYSSRSDE
ncbi:LysR family transcriptional regulator [Celeribacter sp. PS-C1]|uniref:LysR family transcriptional regulator n=1 Tax=Celeribacter sp. PS-C1 TaxID=2820813 RepID=UPI001C67A20D|nr:LysR family transcriptional regulator [Celeribacter sp. PS-C1]MBW6418576.1 LysR family transcriptional regulator [Celeribacter sp. PS-C1]